MTDPTLEDPYRVRRGDTLHGIATRSGKTVAELCQLNQIANPDRIEEGQTLFLTRESAFGISVLFLDRFRHPIENLYYRILHDGQTVEGKTGANGHHGGIVTQDAMSMVEVLVKDFQGDWRSICKTASDYGHKLITLVSQGIVVKVNTEPHPPEAPSHDDDEPQRHPKPPGEGKPSKNNPHVKLHPAKGKHGQAIIYIGFDVPQALLDYFDSYREGSISDVQWQSAADSLSCEVAVLKSIAEVETQGAAFWRLNDKQGRHVPAILYERHKFRELTHGRYDKDHHDISGPRFTAKKGVPESERYGSHATSYLRLINAYHLDGDAALQACSWGKFQIMGNEWTTCGSPSLDGFMRKMCSGEAGQIELLAGFIRRKAGGKLWNAVKHKDWSRIALYYNGAHYKDNNYDRKLEVAYNKFKATDRA